MPRPYFAPNIRKRGFTPPAAGQAFMVAVLLILFAMLTLITLAATLALSSARISELDFKSKRSYFLSESGIEDAVFRLKRGKNLPASYTLALYGANTTITVNNIIGGKDIQSAADIKDVHRIVKTSVKQGTGASFGYAVQVGDGGVLLENSSMIIGNLYSNGDIEGKNTAQITLDAFAASISEIEGDNTFSIGGEARAHQIEEVSVGGNASSTTSISNTSVSKNAYADTISASTIGGDAYYLTSLSGSTVNGATFPGILPPADLPKLNFPISDNQITQWEVAAETDGVHTSPCPYVLDDGTTILDSQKIDCDFLIKNDAVVILRGTLWVRGNFSIENTAQLRLDPSYGSFSEVIIADNPSNRLTSSKILVQNSAKVLGSGSPGSYIALISQNNSAQTGGGEVAIQPKNSADASIYYAPHGLLRIENSTALKEASAYKLHIKNSATVTYETGLASVQFAGPSGSFDILTWLEVP